MKPRMVGSLAAMVVLSAGAFAILGVLVTARIGRPLAPAKAVPELGVGGTQPLAVLADGLRQSLAITMIALRTADRSRGVRALDAAMRASQVGTHAAGGAGLAEKFRDVNRKIEEARVALQDGRSPDAAQLAGAALVILQTLDASSAELPRYPIAVDKYKGAKVLNGRGVRVGEIQRIENDEAVMSIGGVAGLFGFLRFGGQELRVPLDRVLLGQRKAIGTTFVVLPSLATAPDEIRNQIVADVRSKQ